MGATQKGTRCSPPFGGTTNSVYRTRIRAFSTW